MFFSIRRVMNDCPRDVPNTTRAARSEVYWAYDRFNQYPDLGTWIAAHPGAEGKAWYEERDGKRGYAHVVDTSYIVVKLDTLEDLLTLAKAVGDDLIISPENRHPDHQPPLDGDILIYDGYLE